MNYNRKYKHTSGIRFVFFQCSILGLYINISIENKCYFKIVIKLMNKYENLTYLNTKVISNITYYSSKSFSQNNKHAHALLTMEH